MFDNLLFTDEESLPPYQISYLGGKASLAIEYRNNEELCDDTLCVSWMLEVELKRLLRKRKCAKPSPPNYAVSRFFCIADSYFHFMEHLISTSTGLY